MQKPRKLTIVLAILGFSVAALILAYAELTNVSTPPPMNVPLWTTFVVLCPPALLLFALIDIEPGSVAFVLLLLFIGLSNSALYAAIGVGLRRLFRKSD